MQQELQLLEDKILAMVDRLECVQAENKTLKDQVQALQSEKTQLESQTEGESEKLRGILSLLDGIDVKEAETV